MKARRLMPDMGVLPPTWREPNELVYRMISLPPSGASPWGRPEFVLNRGGQPRVVIAALARGAARGGMSTLIGPRHSSDFRERSNRESDSLAGVCPLSSVLADALLMQRAATQRLAIRFA
jgi:hypothetical protein